MHPVFFTIGGFEVRAYAVFMLLAFLAAWWVRRGEVGRLKHNKMPGYHWVPAGALLGAMVGSKLGMVMFEPIDTVSVLLTRMLDLNFTGKTVVGGIIGGYIGVEIAKKAVGITKSTGDGFAVALPVAQGVGRLGCLFNGCCYGVEWAGPWAVEMLGEPGLMRHPVQLYETALDLGLAALLWSLRGRGYPSGHLFKRYLIGYALVRFVTEFFRGDPAMWWGPLKAVQWVCLAAAMGFTASIWRSREAPPQ